MKVINVNSAYRADGSSTLIRLMAEDLARAGKKILVIDNSSSESGFNMMFDLSNSAAIDVLRPFIVGELLTADQLNDAIISLYKDMDIDYISNSEIEPLEDGSLIYILKLLEKEYDYIFIESDDFLKCNELVVENIFVTRPCERTLKNRKNYNQYDIFLINKYDARFNLNFKKLDAFIVNYDPDLVMFYNGYVINLSAETSNNIRTVTNKLIGFELDVLFGEEETSTGFFSRFKLLKGVSSGN